jgi:hypothetical protein
MRDELTLAIVQRIEEKLKERPVFIQKPYFVEPPWQCDSLTNWNRVAPAAVDTALVWTRRPVSANRIGIVTHIGFNFTTAAAITGVEQIWAEVTTTPGVVGNGRVLDTEFNRRSLGATGLGRSACLEWPLPLYSMFIWPGETFQIDFNWGAAPGGFVAGVVWCYEMSQEYIPKEYQR